MTGDEWNQHLNPNSLLTDPVDLFDAVGVPAPPGAAASPRPPGRERVVGELPAVEPFDVFECRAVPAPPGTPSSPRPPGMERVPLTAPPAPNGPLDEYVQRIEIALRTIHDALADIKSLRDKAG